MAVLPLVIAPHPIFKSKSVPVLQVDNEIRTLMDNMLDTIYSEHGIGVAAPMIGVDSQIVVIDLQENGERSPLYMVNPEIIWHSDETKTHIEGSLSFPGITVEITRPVKIRVKYLDYNGLAQELEAEGLLAICIQHEIDYLYGKNLLDYVQPVRRDMLLRKMEKSKKHYTPHVHGEHCQH